MAEANLSNVVPTLSRRLIGRFSLELSDDELKFHPDARHLGEIINNLDKPVEFDLNLSMDKVIRRDHEQHSRMKLESLLKWIMIKYPSSGPPTDFVSPLGVLAKVIRSKHMPEKSWNILATKFHGTIYLKKEMKERVDMRGSQNEKSSTWGVKFEQFMTKGSDPRESCDENTAHYCVVRTELAPHTLLYRVEVDVVDYGYKPSPEECEVDASSNPPVELEASDSGRRLPHGMAHFVELKTSKEYSWGGLPRFKKVTWWSKSRLSGIPRIVCGFKSDDGIVKSLKKYPTKSLVTSPDSKAMTDFLKSFLDYAKKNVVADNPRVVYQLRIDGGRMSCRRLQDSTTRLLTQEYISTFGGVQHN